MRYQTITEQLNSVVYRLFRIVPRISLRKAVSGQRSCVTRTAMVTVWPMALSSETPTARGNPEQPLQPVHPGIQVSFHFVVTIITLNTFCEKMLLIRAYIFRFQVCKTYNVMVAHDIRQLLTCPFCYTVSAFKVYCDIHVTYHNMSHSRPLIRDGIHILFLDF